MTRQTKKIKQLFFTALIMAVGLLFFKYLPMYIYGKDILFDASSHIVWTSFILYLIYLFIEKNKKLRIPYFIFSAIVLIIISIQRIVTKQHNEIGIMLGLIIAVIAIVIPRWKEIRRKIK